MSDSATDDADEGGEWQFSLDEVTEGGQVEFEPDPIEPGSPTFEGVFFVLLGVVLTLVVLFGV
jgi:hypothetical protein